KSCAGADAPSSPLRCIGFFLHSSQEPVLHVHPPPPDMLAPPRIAPAAGFPASGPLAARWMAMLPAALRKLGKLGITAGRWDFIAGMRAGSALCLLASSGASAVLPIAILSLRNSARSGIA